MDQEKPSRYFEIGRIVNTHGVRGHVRVMPSTFDPTRFELLKNITAYNDNSNKRHRDAEQLDSFNNYERLEIQSVSYHKRFVILKFLGIDDMDSAEKLRNYVLRIPEDSALPLEEDEYYIGDLYGLRVMTVEGEYLGVLSDVLFTGANDVYAVRTPCGDPASGSVSKEILIPAIKKCIVNVDIPEGTMTVRLLKGLR